MTPLPSPSPLCLPSGVCCTASTFTCTTLGLTCAATRATGSSSGIREGAGVSGDLWAAATVPLSDPDLFSEHAASRVTARMAAKRRRERAMIFASNVLHTSSRRQGTQFVTGSLRRKVVTTTLYPLRAGAATGGGGAGEFRRRLERPALVVKATS